MKCPTCGHPEMDFDTRDMAHIYNGQQTIIPAVTGDYCPSCGEIVIGQDDTDRVMKVMRAVVQSGVDEAYAGLFSSRSLDEIFAQGILQVRQPRQG
ncbi:MAG: type II toxin-antitoxin system MqsA family antitoxin [Elstera sp.]